MLDGRVPLRAWYPIEVLRFPIRSREQAERKRLGRSGPADPRSRIEMELLAKMGPRLATAGTNWPSMTAKPNGDWLMARTSRTSAWGRPETHLDGGVVDVRRPTASVPCRWQSQPSIPASSTMYATRASARPSAKWTSSLSRTGSPVGAAHRITRGRPLAARPAASLSASAPVTVSKSGTSAPSLSGRRVVLVLAWSVLGGAERAAFMAATYLRDESGADVSVLALTSEHGRAQSSSIAWVSLARAAHRLARRACAESAAAATAGSATSRAPTGCSARVHVAPERPVRPRLASDGSLALRLEPAGCHQGREVRAAPHGIRCKAHSALHRELEGRERLPRARARRAA